MRTKLHKNLSFVILLGVSLMASNCGKEPPVTYLSDDFLAYIDFPVESWWVHENTSTGEKDSLCVTSNERYTDYEKGEGEAEYVIIGYERWENGTKYTIGGGGFPLAPFTQDHNQTYFYRMGWKYSLDERMVMKYPGVAGEKLPSGQGGKIEKVEQQATINGKKYYDVYTMEVPGSTFDGPFPLKQVSIARGVGLVAYITTAEDTFHLIKHHINN